MDENEISNIILKCAIRVHSRLEPGLLESAYEACLMYELDKEGLLVENQKALPLWYDDVELECGYRLDLLVEGKVIVEIKAVKELTDTHWAQLITYLKLSGCKLGLLINFNVDKLKNGGIKRIANNL